MSLECWYYVSGIVSAVIGLVGLCGLLYYANETRKMRIAAENQVENMSRPCVLFMENPPKSGELGGFDWYPLLVKNVGAGAAINIRWRTTNNPRARWVEGPALEAGGCKESKLHIKNVINNGVIECVFESIGGIGYITETGFSGNETELDLRHTFRKLDRNP